MSRFRDRWEPVIDDLNYCVYGRTTTHDGQLCQKVGYEQWAGRLFRLPGTVPVQVSVDFTRLTGQADAALHFGVVDAERLSGYHIQYNYYYGRFALRKKVGPRWNDWVEVEETWTPQVWDTTTHRHELVVGEEGRITFSEDGRVRITWQDLHGLTIGTEVYVFLEGNALGYGGAEAHTHWKDLRVVSLGSSGEEKVATPRGYPATHPRSVHSEIVEDFRDYGEGATLDQILPGIVGVSEKIERVVQLVKRVKGAEVTVLVTGEMGTGKELIARTIHEIGRRRERPFIAVNCAAIPKDLIESELFGHGKGAFTGAVSEKPGLFEAADGGTLFLDEITELDLDAQAKLLRVIEDKDIRRVGETKARRVDVRIITATSKNLEEEMDAGRFRRELYHRLDTVRIHLPPLRERREDIPFLVGYFLTETSKRSGKPLRGCVSQAGMPFVGYTWPGNVRELQHEIERLVLMMGEDGIIWPEDVSAKIRRRPEECALEEACGRRLPDLSFQQAVAQYKRWLVEEALKECGGNVTQAAKRLGLKRQMLQWLMRQMGVKRGDNE